MIGKSPANHRYASSCADGAKCRDVRQQDARVVLHESARGARLGQIDRDDWGHRDGVHKCSEQSARSELCFGISQQRWPRGRDTQP